MHELKKMIREKLKAHEERGTLTGASLEEVHILTDTLKNIDKIEMLEGEEYSHDGYSMRRRYSRDAEDYPNERMMYPRDGSYAGRGYDRRGDSGDSYDSYDEGESYRRGHYVRGHYSRADGKAEMLAEMEKLLGMAKTPEEKKAIERCMQQME